MVTFGVSTKSYQTATLNMVTLFFMIMTAFIEIIMPHLISTSYNLSSGSSLVSSGTLFILIFGCESQSSCIASRTAA